MKLWPFHRHRFFEVTREFMFVEHTTLSNESWPLYNGPATVITERCVENRCRKWKQVTLKGNVPGAQSAEEELLRLEENV